MTFLEHYLKRVLMGSYADCDIAIDTVYVKGVISKVGIQFALLTGGEKNP